MHAVPTQRTSTRGRAVRRRVWLLAVAGASLAGARTSAESAEGPDAQFGPSPALPPPQHRAIPTVNIAPARGWAEEGERPTAGRGLAGARLAGGLDHPRRLYVLPNGDVLVA